MERLLQSSIMGKDFINYRKQWTKNERLRFSNKVRNQGMGQVPIVVDSVDKELSLILSVMEDGRTSERCRKYGKQFVFHMDDTLEDVLKEVKILLIQRDKEVLMNKVRIGLENGNLPDQSCTLGDLYKAHKNEDDKILYLLLTQQNSMYDYIISIIKHLTESIKMKFMK